ncbi:MAG: protein kinase domain-containing protein [Planctomycetota bacterium]
MARLVWKPAAGSPSEFSIGERAVLGREEGVECRIQSRGVSRRHARIELREGAYYLEDLGSRNGTAVNGSAVRGEVKLEDGDRIQVGEEVLEFRLEGASEPPTRGSMATESLAASSAERWAASRRAAGETLPRREGKFHLLCRLGQGGMGVVYRALDLDSNRVVAVKFIRPDLGRNEAFLDFFHNREAVLAREIQHPNVIAVYEHGVRSEQHYISMEYVPGENLHQVGKRRRLEVPEVLEIVRQIACGLAAAHRRGVVHSDVKPGNILLLSPGDASQGASGASSTAADDLGDVSGILEAPEEAPPEAERAEARARYEPALLEEIRRRVGEEPVNAVLDPPYFPRPSETNFLRHYFDKLREGKGCFVLVEGDAGTGKDRLVSEFLRQAAGEPEPSGCGGLPGEEPIPIYEFDCSRIEGIALLHEQVFGARPWGPASAQRMMADVVRRFERDAGPKVLRILDLGSATQLARDLILACAELMGRQGLLLIASVDQEDFQRNASLKALLDRVSGATKELYLRPLTEYQVQRYLDQLFPDAVRDERLPGDLYRLSRGNFARLLEILRSFFERGILALDPVSRRLTYRPRAQEFELEEGKGFFEKYRGYGRVEQRVLEQAAFVGPRFLFDTILRLNDLGETSLFFVLRTLVADAFFTDEGGGWYAFTNAAFQKYLGERVPLSERIPFHRRISRLLESAPVRDSAELRHLKGRHLAGCREYARAVEEFLEGAYRARSEYREDLFRELFQEILGIYRQLAGDEKRRKEVTGILRDRFRRDGNWYEILGELSSEFPKPLVKIADFGISFRLRDEPSEFEVGKRPAFGTPRYLAPERSRGEPGGFKSDIFALGVIAYELAAGTPPFPDLKGPEVIEANRTRPIRLPPEAAARFPEGMAAFLDGMLEKDPEKRWDADRVIAEATRLQFELRQGARGGRP